MTTNNSVGKEEIIPKPVKERDNLDLLNLICELSGRSAMHNTKVLHDAFWEARKELESRLQPLSLSAEGVDKEAILKEVVEKSSIRYFKDENNYLVDAQHAYAAMTEYSQLQNKHSIENFKNMTERCNKYHDDISHLQQQLKEKENEISRLKKDLIKRCDEKDFILKEFDKTELQNERLQQQLKEKDEKIEELLENKNHYVENFKNMTSRCNSYVDEVLELQQLLPEKEKEINEYSLNLKNAVERGGKLVHEKIQLQKEIEYYKQLAEAAHKLIDHTGWGNTADWEKYESLKNQKPTT